MSKNFKVSAIMPVFNCEAFVCEAIESVLNQTHDNFELIIINDGSTDQTANMINGFIDNRIKLINLDKNLGVAEARNKGLSIASGEFIGFCDADDIWHSNKLDNQISLMIKNNFLVCHSDCRVIDEKGRFIEKRSYPKIVTYEMMKHRNYICNSSAIYDSRELGIFKQKQIYHEDYLMWLSIMKVAKKSISSQSVALDYRSRKKSLSSQKFLSLIGSFKIQYKHGISITEIILNLFKNFYSRFIKK